jgi:hypothetical protein
MTNGLSAQAAVWVDLLLVGGLPGLADYIQLHPTRRNRNPLYLNVDQLCCVLVCLSTV